MNVSSCSVVTAFKFIQPQFQDYKCKQHGCSVIVRMFTPTKIKCLICIYSSGWKERLWPIRNWEKAALFFRHLKRICFFILMLHDLKKNEVILFSLYQHFLVYISLCHICNNEKKHAKATWINKSKLFWEN